MDDLIERLRDGDDLSSRLEAIHVIVSMRQKINKAIQEFQYIANLHEDAAWIAEDAIEDLKGD